MKRVNVRNLVIGTVVGVALPLLAYAQFNGPATQPPSGNAPGVIWNVKGTGLLQTNAEINIPALKTNSVSKDVSLQDGSSFRLDKVGAATYHIGNWGAGSQPFTFYNYGDLVVTDWAGAPYSQGSRGRISATEFCFNPGNPADCIQTWPSGGGGGTITSISAGTGISVATPGGPVPVVSINSAWTDARYVLKAGDTMTGQLTVNTNGAAVGSVVTTNSNATGIGGKFTGGAFGTQGVAVQTSGIGVQGTANVPGGIGIKGVVNNTTNGYGGWFSGGFEGVYASGDTWGINGAGLSATAVGVQGTGFTAIQGQANPGGTAVNGFGGLYGGLFFGSAYGVYSQGPVGVTGLGTATAGGIFKWWQAPWREVALGTAAFTIEATGTSRFSTTGGGYAYVGDAGCGGGWEGIQLNNKARNCANYAILGGDASFPNDTYFNRPSGGQIQFREANVYQMTIAAGGNVAIGNSIAPTAKLDITGAGSSNIDLKVNGRIQTGDANRLGGVWVQPDASGMFMGEATPNLASTDRQLGFYTAATGWLLSAHNSGRVGIGMGQSAPTQVLSVNGNADKFSGGTTWAVWSDKRLKDVHGTFDRGLDALMLINPVSFSYKVNNIKGLPSNETNIGLIAQEVQKAVPEAVTTREDGYLQLQADPVFWTMLNSIKELKKENDSLKSKLDSLETRLEKLEKAK